MDDWEPARGHESEADDELPPSPSDVLLWRLGKLYLAWRAGEVPGPPSRWDISMLDETEGVMFAAPHCIELELSSEAERRWHLSTGEVLVLDTRFQEVINPFTVVSAESWAQLSDLQDAWGAPAHTAQ